jgi:hypothetical protein
MEMFANSRDIVPPFRRPLEPSVDGQKMKDRLKGRRPIPRLTCEERPSGLTGGAGIAYN